MDLCSCRFFFVWGFVSWPRKFRQLSDVLYEAEVGTLKMRDIKPHSTLTFAMYLELPWLLLRGTDHTVLAKCLPSWCYSASPKHRDVFSGNLFFVFPFQKSLACFVESRCHVLLHQWLVLFGDDWPLSIYNQESTFCFYRMKGNV